MGKLIRAISGNGMAVCYALDSTDMVGELEQIHRSSAVVTAATGRLLTAASIMGSMLKGEGHSITLGVSGGGPAGSVIAVADAAGNAKAYATNPVVEIPLNPRGKLDVSGAVGREGKLYVIRDQGRGEPYVGLVPLVSGEIAEDITSYFATSEQVPTVCALGVLVDTDQSVLRAGGYLIQLLPGADDAVIDRVEAGVQALGPVTAALLEEGMDAEGLLRRALAGFDLEILERRPVEYRCYCSRERVARALVSMGPGELKSLIEEQGGAELTCQFCDAVYQFSREELTALLERAGR